MKRFKANLGVGIVLMTFIGLVAGGVAWIYALSGQASAQVQKVSDQTIQNSADIANMKESIKEINDSLKQNNDTALETNKLIKQLMSTQFYYYSGQKTQ